MEKRSIEDKPKGRWWATLPVRAYLLSVLLVFVVIGGFGTYVVSSQSHDTAASNASSTTSEAAHSSALEVFSALASNVATLTNLTKLATGGVQLSGCHSLLVQVSNDVLSGHLLSIVAKNGALFCTSASQAPTHGYVGARWLPAGATTAGNYGPFRDPIDGQLSLITTTQIMIDGQPAVAVLSQPFAPLGQELALLFGGTDHLSFIITSPDNKTIYTSSEGGDELTGVSAAKAGFDVHGSPTESRPGPTGVDTFFNQSTVPHYGWHVFAGETAAVALGAANHLRAVVVLILLLGILFMSAFLIVAYRMVTGPLFRVTRGLRVPEGRAVPEPVPEEGPVEVAAIGRGVNRLIAGIDSELARRRAAEATARESLQSYQQLFEANPVPMVLIDPETLRFIDVNVAAMNTYGYRWQEFEQLHAPDLWVSDNPDIGSSMRNSGSVDSFGPLNHKRKDGSIIRVLVTSRTITFDGRAVRFSLYEDVTERERLLQATEQNQRLESLGELAGGIAHDFNNLLSVIMNYAEFVKENPVVASEQAAVEDVDQIIRASGRAAELTANLLRFARREIVEPRPFEVNAAVHDVETMLRRTLGEHITLQTNLAADELTVVADPGQFEQILVNLAVNARDAMPDVGTLHITTETQMVRFGDPETVQGLSPGAYVRVVVTDSGTGMTEEAQARAFEPFFTTKARGKGTGLGLSTVYGIVTGAGGSVTIDSTPGEGTTISMLFPSSSDDAAAGLAPWGDANDDGRHNSQRVLVVDDEPAVGRLVERILREAGYQVDSVTSGSEGLALLEELDRPVDLLLSDVVMPEMSGVELAHEVHLRVPSAKVLFMSGYADPGSGLSDSLDEGVELLRKPFSEEVLLAKVAQTLSS